MSGTLHPAVRVVLADDHTLFRAGIRAVLDAADGVDVVGEAATGGDALDLVRALRPDVLLLDMEMPGGTGVDVARALRAGGDAVRVLALSAYDDGAYVRGLMDLGAAGYLTKDEAPDRLVEAVRAVARGETGWLSPAAQAGRADRPDGSGALTSREREVLALVAEGLDNAAVSTRLSIAERTARNHLTSILAKIGVRTRAEAVAWAWRHGHAGPGAP